MADYTLARQALEEMGEQLAELGWTKPQQIIEGNNKVGNAVRDCRNDRCTKLVATALKGWAKEVKALPPSQKKNQIVAVMNDAWETFKAAMNEGLEDDHRPTTVARRR